MHMSAGMSVQGVTMEVRESQIFSLPVSVKTGFLTFASVYPRRGPMSFQEFSCLHLPSCPRSAEMAVTAASASQVL